MTPDRWTKRQERTRIRQNGFQSGTPERLHTTASYKAMMRRFDTEARKAREKECRRIALSEFCAQHDAPWSTSNWDDDLRMMFAIQYPEVTL